MNSVKIVLIGAGSASFGPGTITSLLAAPPLRERGEVSIVLVDTDEAALGTMLGFAEAVREYRGSEARLEATTDRRAALPGADFVITSVARQRYELWRQDFLIPLAFGFKQPYGECGGPGAAFHTLRSLHLMVPIARDMEVLCPGALLLNFTNPESRVCLAVSMLTRVRAVGLCHGFHTTYAAVANVLERPADDLELDLGGLNHFHWVLAIRDKHTGADLLPEFDRRMQARAASFGQLTRELYATFGRLPFPSESHVAEFVPYGYAALGPYYLQFEAAVLADAPLGLSSHMAAVRAVAQGQAALTPELAAPSGELAAPIICDMLDNTGARREAVNVPNTANAIGNLPEDCVVEVPAVVDASGVHPVAVGALPEGIAAMCRLQDSIQKLLVEAYATRSKTALLQALLLEPVVDDVARARAMMDRLLALQADYLSEFSD